MSTHDDRGKTASKETEELAAQLDAIREDLANLTNTVSRMTTARVSEARETAREKVDQAQDSAREKVDEFEDTVRRNPLQAALFAIGIGFLIGIFARR